MIHTCRQPRLLRVRLQLVKLLTEDVEKLTGGKRVLGDDPTEVAGKIEQVINGKRKGLGIPV